MTMRSSNESFDQLSAIFRQLTKFRFGFTCQHKFSHGSLLMTPSSQLTLVPELLFPRTRAKSTFGTKLSLPLRLSSLIKQSLEACIDFAFVMVFASNTKILDHVIIKTYHACQGLSSCRNMILMAFLLSMRTTKQ